MALHCYEVALFVHMKPDLFCTEAVYTVTAVIYQERKLLRMTYA